MKDFYETKLLRHLYKDPITNCWNWTGYVTKYGYGETRLIDKKKVRVHRLSMFVWKDFDLNSELDVLHDCDNRRCFNVEHLFIGTNLDNMKDKVSKNRQSRKLDKQDLLEIIKYFTEKEFSVKELAEIYKVSKSAIKMKIKKFNLGLGSR